MQKAFEHIQSTPCQVVCLKCGQVFEATAIEFASTELRPSVCDACSEEYEQQRVEAARQELLKERIKDFKDLCPPRMFDFDPELFPSDISKFEECMSEPLLSMGLLIHGTTGTGKSRVLWQLARRLVIEEHRQVLIFRDVEFGRMIERSFEGNYHDSLISKLCKCSVLLIDDFGKSRLTMRVEADLFDVIDSRYNAERPVVYTTQFTGESLARRFNDPETAVAIIRRMKHECLEINLRKTT